MLLLPATPGESWFTTFGQGDWLVCFLHRKVAQPHQILAFHGDHKHGFWLVFQRIATVLRTPQF